MDTDLYAKIAHRIDQTNIEAHPEGTTELAAGFAAPICTAQARILTAILHRVGPAGFDQRTAWLTDSTDAELADYIAEFAHPAVRSSVLLPADLPGSELESGDRAWTIRRDAWRAYRRSVRAVEPVERYRLIAAWAVAARSSDPRWWNERAGQPAADVARQFAERVN